METFDIIEAVDQGVSVDLVLLDFAKIFDRYLRKAYAQTQRVRYNRWTVEIMREFLSNRKRIMIIGDISSCWKDVISGMPQGSVFGPLCLNNIQTIVNS